METKAKKVTDLIEQEDPHGFPRHKVKSVDTRKRDLVIRIADWMRDKDEPAYDVEVYIAGVYDYNESESFTLSSGLSKQEAKTKATEFVCAQIKKLLK